MKGHVRERGKGNWYAVLSTRDPQTGKRKVRFISLPNANGKRDAQQGAIPGAAASNARTANEQRADPQNSG